MASLGHPIIGDSLYHQLGYEQQQRQHQQQEQQQELSLYSMNPSSVGATKNGGSNAVDCGDDEDERQRLRKGRGMFLMSCEIRFLVAGIDGRPGKTWAVCRIKEANKFEKLRRKAEKGYRWRLERNHK